ncbi:MAG TPA: hypothetical protein VFY29_20305 [Terriglobia bacterium]|nr:hypothetical protein [Terriglobia bacterium]
MKTQTGGHLAADEAPRAERTLRRLFLTLFLRGRSARGLQKSKAPSSIGSKLLLALCLYAAFGLAALPMWFSSIFALSALLHAMTFVFLGMFVAASSGEILFNREEGDILLHRPVPPRAMLWAKVRVLVEVSLWMAGALNLVSFVVGVFMPAGAWLFPIAHAVSITLEALFTTGCVVVVYQLCLRWFGRERLEGLMTTAQVIVAVASAMVGQIVPRLIGSFPGKIGLELKTWWLGLLPPVWFASFDDAVTGAGGPGSWALAGWGLLVTVAVLGMAFGKLARDYERGLQALGESAASPRRAAAGRRWFDRMVNAPPFRWWLRDSVGRASFLLTAAYLVRDRDVKLRVYPSVAPSLVLSMLYLFNLGGAEAGSLSAGFAAAFFASFICLAAPATLSALRYSQQWRAADIFRAAPISGPAQLSHGARRAVLSVIIAPLCFIFVGVAWLAGAHAADLILMLPGLIALPVFAIATTVTGRMTPLSESSEEAAAVIPGFAGRRVVAALAFLVGPFALSGLGALAKYTGWFWWFAVAEALVAVLVYGILRARMASLRWRPLE